MATPSGEVTGHLDYIAARYTSNHAEARYKSREACEASASKEAEAASADVVVRRTSTQGKHPHHQNMQEAAARSDVTATYPSAWVQKVVRVMRRMLEAHPVETVGGMIPGQRQSSRASRKYDTEPVGWTQRLKVIDIKTNKAVEMLPAQEVTQQAAEESTGRQGKCAGKGQRHSQNCMVTEGCWETSPYLPCYAAQQLKGWSRTAEENHSRILATSDTTYTVNGGSAVLATIQHMSGYEKSRTDEGSEILQEPHKLRGDAESHTLQPGHSIVFRTMVGAATQEGRSHKLWTTCSMSVTMVVARCSREIYSPGRIAKVTQDRALSLEMQSIDEHTQAEGDWRDGFSRAAGEGPQEIQNNFQVQKRKTSFMCQETGTVHLQEFLLLLEINTFTEASSNMSTGICATISDFC